MPSGIASTQLSFFSKVFINFFRDSFYGITSANPSAN